MMMHRILVINPGSTSTKIACFEDKKVLMEVSVRHPTEILQRFETVAEQYPLRHAVLCQCLEEQGVDVALLDAVVGRGGILRPVSSGTYVVNDLMLDTLRSGNFGEHAANLGALLAYRIAKDNSIPAFIVDPVVVDELQDVARVSGFPGIERRSVFHALNQKAVARRAAKEMGRPYEEVRLIVAHLGGGITVGVHRDGCVVDVNNGVDGEGAMSPERSGGVPAASIAALMVSGGLTLPEIRRRLTGKGGLVGYLGTSDCEEVQRRIDAEDAEAILAYRAMAYQVAKEIGASAAVLCGDVDAVVLTGGLAHWSAFVELISSYIRFVAPVMIFPGEDEMAALAAGALRVLRGEETAKNY